MLSLQSGHFWGLEEEGGGRAVEDSGAQLGGILAIWLHLLGHSEPQLLQKTTIT